MWKIGNIEIKNRVVLAPMAGISNPSYIKLLEDFGLGYAITELISSEALIRGNNKTFEMLNGISELNIPVAIQIFGSNPDTMAKAAKILVDKYDVKIIDINMGCPVPKVAISNNAGSGLLRNPILAGEIVKAVVNSVNIPVTVKIRSGWDMNSINAVEVAKICEENGASAITVHPRTRSQKYEGHSDWNIIREVKENVSIPVIGNGDIKSVLDAKKMFEETNCDAVMIGRSALGNPWIIKDTIDYFNTGVINDKITKNERIDMCIRHFEYLLKFKYEKVALLEMRQHASWYLKGLEGANEVKNAIFNCDSKDKLLEILNNFRD